MWYFFNRWSSINEEFCFGSINFHCHTKCKKYKKTLEYIFVLLLWTFLQTFGCYNFLENETSTLLYWNEFSVHSVLNFLDLRYQKKMFHERFKALQLFLVCFSINGEDFAIWRKGNKTYQSCRDKRSSGKWNLDGICLSWLRVDSIVSLESIKSRVFLHFF